jgi:hypothetical protein
MYNRKLMAGLLLGTALLTTSCDKVRRAVRDSDAVVAETAYPERVLFGDLHLHTANSVDAFGFGVRLGPEAEKKSLQPPG